MFNSKKSGRLLLGIALLVLSAVVLLRVFFPPQPRLSQESWSAMFPYQTQHIDLENGARIHYVDEGAGTTLLLMHGNPTSSFLYRHLIAELKSDYRVVVPDYPGFGRSTAPAGYGFTAQEQADSMVEFFDLLKLDDDAYAGYFQTFLDGDRTPVTVFPQELIAATSFLSKVENGMAGISEHPALIVWGAQDFAFRETERQRFETIFPNHSTTLLPDAGHFLQEDAPDEIASAIRQAFP